jgi:hypothetical protein
MDIAKHRLHNQHVVGAERVATVALLIRLLKSLPRAGIFSAENWDYGYVYLLECRLDFGYIFSSFFAYN